MKLASLKHGRDGSLVVVSRDATRMLPATSIVPTLQDALDNWDLVKTSLEGLSNQLNASPSVGIAFDAGMCASPLPRAYQWLDASAYLNHVELVRRARGAEMPASLQTDPIMYQGISDVTLAPGDPINFCEESWGIDLEAELAVVTGEVPVGADIGASTDAIRLFMLVNDISLRNLIPAELAKGFGFVNGKPPCAFAPIAVTPDELGLSWRDGKVHLPIYIHINGELFGRPDAGIDMTFTFAQLIAHAARTRSLSVGTIVGAGTVSNRFEGGPGQPIEKGGAGYACLAERRMVETIETGASQTPFLAYGDKIAIEMFCQDGTTLFGRIEQTVCQPERA